MKKLIFILFAAILFCGEAWAATVVPLSGLKSGHYYRIRGSGKGYMCWTGLETASNSQHALMMKQPVVFVNAEKACTSPGTIWLYTGSATNCQLTAQNIEFRTGLNRGYIGFEQVRQQSVLFWDVDVEGLRLNTSSNFTLEEPTDATLKANGAVFFKTNGNGASGLSALGDRDCYLQPTTNGYLGVTSAQGASAAFYFEEVDGTDDAYLGFPPADQYYKISGRVLNTSGSPYQWYYSGSDKTTNDGTALDMQYEITDVQSGSDARGTVWYYATMCLPFPVEVPTNVQCFFVNSQKQTVAIQYNDNNLNGTGRFAKSVNVIPAGTPFVARSTSNLPSANRFVPYVPEGTSTVYAPTNASVNALKKANSYLVKNAQNSTTYNNTINLYKLSSTSNGEVEFLTQITSNSEATDGNRAYFGQQSDPIVYEPDSAELADLIYEKENGADKWTDKDYVKISDELVVGYVNTRSGLVFARDNENNKTYWDKVISTPNNYYNFTPTGGELYTPSYYNQSNWVIIQVPISLIDNFTEGMTIPANSLKGSIQTDKTRPIFNMVAYETQATAADIGVNTYSVAHLMAGEDHLVTSNANGKDYFFMTPRPVEVAKVTWAVLHKSGNNVYAYIPKHADGVNGLDFRGKVLLSPEFYAGSSDDWTEAKLQEMDGKTFEFLAALTNENGASMANVSSNVPRKAEGYNEDDPTSTTHVIYPLELTQDQVITSVQGVNESKTVKSVKFYNLQGIASDTPQQGINIVVELFDDGTTRSSKMLF